MLNRRFLKAYSSAGALAPFTLDWLVIAGGGSGNPGGGGGGAGGYRTSYGTGNISGRNSAVEAAKTITPGTAYSVTIGTGGAPMGVTSDTQALTTGGAKGVNSIFDNITSTGGGAGTYYPSAGFGGYTAKHNGGSGGGAVFGGSGGHNAGNTSGIAAQGFGGNGGTVGGNTTYSGAGGGAGGTGSSSGAAGAGGIGIASSITGTSVQRAGGGSAGPWGGGSRTARGWGGGGGGSSVNAIDGTGGGGGGGGSTSGSQSNLRAGGNGGDGIVILRYTNLATATLSGSLTGTETVDGADKVLQITGGSGTVIFS